MNEILLGYRLDVTRVDLESVLAELDYPVTGPNVRRLFQFIRARDDLDWDAAMWAGFREMLLRLAKEDDPTLYRPGAP
jgi:hypothetical protein